MRPAVVAAALLLVGTIISVTDHRDNGKYNTMTDILLNQPPPPKKPQAIEALCVFTVPQWKKCPDMKTDSELVSLHDEGYQVMCLSLLYSANHDPEPFWIGAKRSGEGFTYTDGSEFDDTNWLPNTPGKHGGQECVESITEAGGLWDDVGCSEKKSCVCVKRK
ncbi:C-type isolectin Sp-CL4-like [Cebidichthys violaceus]|uniref:C-type isolectin Sp-CL4-like n=1 Tax=Cebidichthys violaceus TaxID=271503 RepID=UPI0035CC4E6A